MKLLLLRPAYSRDMQLAGAGSAIRVQNERTYGDALASVAGILGCSLRCCILYHAVFKTSCCPSDSARNRADERKEKEGDRNSILIKGIVRIFTRI
jgi:hypothetical protein